MFIVLSKITFTQVPTVANPTRKKTLVFPFVHSYEASNNWDSLTNKAKITLPKAVKILDENNRALPIGGTNINIGGFEGQAPLFLRGDKVTIEHGYQYYDKAGNEVSPVVQIFSGYVSKISPRLPFEIECEDSMYLLKHANAPQKTYKGFTVETMLADMVQLADLPLTVNQKTQTVLGTFPSTNMETIAQVLARLKKDFHFNAYFKGNELRCGAFVYLPEDNVGQTVYTFQFQRNIIRDELEYKRLDDITLSAIAHNTITEETGTTTKDGHAKTKTSTLEVLVTLTSRGVQTYVKKNKSDEYPANTEGDRRELFYTGAKTIADLITLATQELQHYYYAGLRGKFTTFGLPFVQQGDNVKIVDKKLPERNGTYKVKSVEYSGGVEGLRQHIELDFRI